MVEFPVFEGFITHDVRKVRARDLIEAQDKNKGGTMHLFKDGTANPLNHKSKNAAAAYTRGRKTTCEWSEDEEEEQPIPSQKKAPATKT